MTDYQHESDDQSTAKRTDPVAGQPIPPADDRVDPARGTSVPAAPAPGHPGSGYGYPGLGPALGYEAPPAYSQPAYPPRQAGGAKTGLIVGGAIGLVVVLGIGIAIGISVSGNHGDSASATALTSPTAASPRSAPSATTARPDAAPGKYSMSAVANACDLVDPTPLKKWSSTPTSPVHMEDPANSADGGSLLCQIQYTSTSATDGVTTDQAGIGLQVQFTGAAGPPAYDGWKSTDTTPQPGWSSGTITGLGARGFWHAIGTTDTGSGGTYIVGVQDSNISVRVEVAVHRAHGEAPVDERDLATIAQSQARTVLDRLRKS